MTAAVEAAQGSSTSVIAVTVLTSMSVDGLRAMGMKHISDEQGLRAYVVQLALAAQQAGCAGVVASPQEVVALREACGPDFMIVTPGVRPIWAQLDDQKRVATPKEALKAGADYLVIGRPLTSPPKEIGNSVAAARRLLGEMSTMQGN